MAFIDELRERFGVLAPVSPSLSDEQFGGGLTDLIERSLQIGQGQGISVHQLHREGAGGRRLNLHFTEILVDADATGLPARLDGRPGEKP